MSAQRYLSCFVLLLAGCNEEDPDLVYEAQLNQWQSISYEQGLSSNLVNEIFEDSKGRMWFGTNRGISLLSDNRITTFSRGNGLVDDNVFAISEDNDGNIWAGTGRGVNIYVDEKWQYFPSLYRVPVYDLIPLRDDGGMLIGTGRFGVYRFDYTAKKFSVFNFIEGCEPCNSINSLFQAKDGSVWIASSDGARRVRESFITKFDTDDGLAGKITTTIAEDSWGNIWIGSFEGRTISKVNGNVVSQVSFNNGAEQNFIFGIQEDNSSNLWVGTVGNGLFHYDGAIMKPVVGGPDDDIITVLYKDRKGNLWVGTSSAGVGQYRVNPK